MLDLFRGEGQFTLGLERDAEAFAAPLADRTVGHSFQPFDDSIAALPAHQRADAEDHACHAAAARPLHGAESTKSRNARIVCRA
jgi:hypothetical protein